MIVTVADVGDVEVREGTSLGAVLDAVGQPRARWCANKLLDPTHRAGRAPLIHGALLTAEPGGPPPARREGAWIQVVGGPDAGATVDVTGPLTVGRMGADLTVDDPRLSRVHLRVDPSGRVRDLGSANGTAVRRGKRARSVGRTWARSGARTWAMPRWRTRLTDGDVIEAGGTVIAWHGGATANRASPVSGRQTVPLAGAAAAIVGGLVLGAVTGRWWIGAIVAVAPLTAVAFSLVTARRARSGGREAVGIERLANPAGPLAIVGSRPQVTAVARAVALASGRAWHHDHPEPWNRWLGPALAGEEITVVAPGEPVPSEAATVIDLTAGVLTVDGVSAPWLAALVTPGTADREARVLLGAASGLPSHVRWGDLGAPAHAPRRLLARLGCDEAGATVTLDLDHDGPHVLVAGTTGSGKSMLLETLVAGLAFDHSPADLAIALIDFKGGAGLASCLELPHVRGVLTDLEPAHARRALHGLRHELDLRKRTAARQGFTSWSAWEAAGSAPPRLLVVIDEFQELANRDADFVPEVVRMAAQGRSLGLHLVLATQRPAGVVTADIRANMGAVIALRVASPAESHDLIGDSAAATLPAAHPGRAVVSAPAWRTVMQSALPMVEPSPLVAPVGAVLPPGAPVAVAASARWGPRDGVARGVSVARRSSVARGSSKDHGDHGDRLAPADPGDHESAADHGDPLWLAPLDPAVDIAPAGAAGWLDLPARRARVPLAWDPASGPCVILGGRGAHRSAIALALARALPRAVILPDNPREAVRTLHLARRTGAPVVILDAERAIESVERVLRSPGEAALASGARAVPLVIAAGPGWPARWAGRAGLAIVLPGLAPLEQSLWGVPRELQQVSPGPGRGVAIVAGGGSGSVGECLVDVSGIGGGGPPAPRASGGPLVSTLVAPLTVPADLPAGAIGVVGDAAVPLMPGRGPIVVVGPPGRERDAVVDLLTRSSNPENPRPTVHDHPPPGEALLAIVEPDASRVRAWGLPLEPGLVDPDPPPGRVLLVKGRHAAAAQLRRVTE